MNSEGFKPISNTPPTSVLGKCKFFGRMVLDLQILTIFRDVKENVPQLKGGVLDVGCGQSPYKFLLNSAAEYKGIDILDADKFDYNNSEITHFNGEDIPFEDNVFEGVICTEVLEHVQNYQKLVNEMHRVMKKDAKALITVPWGARYHYIPYDFFRYTPSSLKTMFEQFSDVKIWNRGTDITNIASKIIVLWFRNLFPLQKWKYIFTPLWILFSPILLIAVLIAHLSIWFNLGSSDDPLGYTVLVKK